MNKVEALTAGLMIISGWYGQGRCHLSPHQNGLYYGPAEVDYYFQDNLPAFHLNQLKELGWVWCDDPTAWRFTFGNG